MGFADLGNKINKMQRKRMTNQNYFKKVTSQDTAFSYRMPGLLR